MKNYRMFDYFPRRIIFSIALISLSVFLSCSKKTHCDAYRMTKKKKTAETSPFSNGSAEKKVPSLFPENSPFATKAKREKENPASARTRKKKSRRFKFLFPESKENSPFASKPKKEKKKKHEEGLFPSKIY